MSQRLQVLLEDDEFDELRAVAKANRMTVAEWVRQALRAARRTEPVYDVGRKLTVVREAAQYRYPTADMGELLHTIERSYRDGITDVDAAAIDPTEPA
jgi:hypothetical protein